MAKRTPAARDTRARILDAALSEFSSQGFTGASIDEIAARAGVTKGAVYYYFQDKDDLARELQHAIWERLIADAVEVIDPAEDVVTSLLHGFDAYLAALQALPEARFFLRDSWTVSPTETEQRDEQVAFVRGLIDEGIARGEIVRLDPEATARMLLGLFAEATLYVLQTGEPGPTVEVVSRFVHALAPAGTRAKARR